MFKGDDNPAVIFPLAIGFSRIYLSVHYPRDVPGGWLIGIAFLALSLAAIKTAAERLHFRPATSLLVALLAPLLLLALAYSEDSLRDMAVLMGLGAGAVAEREWVRFEKAAEAWAGGWGDSPGLVILRALAETAVPVSARAGVPVYPLRIHGPVGRTRGTLVVRAAPAGAPEARVKPQLMAAMPARAV